MFDVDGVLIDSEPVWERVRRNFVATRGGRWPDDAQDRMMGMSTAEWSAYISEDFGLRGLSAQQVAELVTAAMAAEYTAHLPLLPGAVAAVRDLSARWPLAVASSAPKSLIDAVLDASGLRPAFAAAVSSEEVARGKPAPTSTWRRPRGSASPGGVRRRRGLLQRPAVGGGGRHGRHRGPPSGIPARPRRAAAGPRRP